jgi:hypothetical protein
MRAVFHLAIPLALLAVGCESVPDPVAPDATSPLFSAQAGSHTSVFANVNGDFGPFVIASCEGGYDLIYQQTGTVTVIVTTDATGNITKVQDVWNLTASYTNSVTGYSISGPSYGPDQTTFNSDGTSRLIQVGLIVVLKTPDGIHLVDAGRLEFLIDANGISLVQALGPHPIHEDFPERPVLCALINH